MRELFKRLYFALRPSNRMVILDYAIDPKPIYTSSNPHKGLFNLVSSFDASFKNLLEYSMQFKNIYHAIKDSKDEEDKVQPAWNNSYIPALDIIILYSLLNLVKPKKYIEIGSGTTTKTAYKARKDNKLDFRIICIDPSPRLEIKGIADEWHPSLIQNQSHDLFKDLSENDIVFFDGTHTLYPNSDVMWFFLEVLPMLPKGVLVQVHDIYIPYDYPQFMCNRYYSENYLLGALLLNNPDKYEIIAPNFYMSEQKFLAEILNELWIHPSLRNLEKHGGSFWFKIK